MDLDQTVLYFLKLLVISQIQCGDPLPPVPRWSYPAVTVEHRASGSVHCPGPVITHHPHIIFDHHHYCVLLIFYINLYLTQYLMFYVWNFLSIDDRCVSAITFNKSLVGFNFEELTNTRLSEIKLLLVI